MSMPFQFFGTSGAVPTHDRDNTALAVYTTDHIVLVDCSGSPYQRILHAGLDPSKVAALVVTHAHPDHIFGLPSLAHNLGLAGRRAPLDIYGLAETMKYVEGLMELFPLEKKMRYTVECHVISPEPRQALQLPGLTISAAPVVHAIPAVGIRAEFDTKEERGAVVFSGDNRPSEALVSFARGAHTLIHEATRLDEHQVWASAEGHTTAREAGEVATRAGVQRLLLCHFAFEIQHRLKDTHAQAKSAFAGPVELAREYYEYRV
jgi:ribonuclease Z